MIPFHLRSERVRVHLLKEAILRSYHGTPMHIFSMAYAIDGDARFLRLALEAKK